MRQLFRRSLEQGTVYIVARMYRGLQLPEARAADRDGDTRDTYYSISFNTGVPSFTAYNRIETPGI